MQANTQNDWRIAVDAQLIATLDALHAQGHKIAFIAREIGLCYKTTYRAIKRIGPYGRLYPKSS